MPRFYCPQPLVNGSTIELPEAVAHHLHVVRLQPGAALTLFNGDGGQYRATLVETGKRRATAVIDGHEAHEAELPYAVTLAQGLPEGSKMDWIIEKAVELGVAAIQPLAAPRSVVRLSGERLEKRQAHWHGVIVAASEQSGRNRLAQLLPMTDVQPWLAASAGTTRILLSPRATESLAGWARATCAAGGHPPDRPGRRADAARRRRGRCRRRAVAVDGAAHAAHRNGRAGRARRAGRRMGRHLSR